MTSEIKKIALITGASRGIGQAITTLLAQNDIYVIGTATSDSGATAISNYLSEKNLSGESHVLDITSEDAVNALYDTLQATEKLPNIIVNNAGVTCDDLLLRMSEEAWGKVINTNLTGAFRVAKTFLRPMFKKRWGRIINIASVVGSTGNAGQVNYVASKAGLVGFTKSLAQEIASRGITVNAVAPGFIETDMTASLPDMVQQEILKKVPMKALGLPDDIAQAVLFLSGQSAKYITGETIHVNGGMYMA